MPELTRRNMKKILALLTSVLLIAGIIIGLASAPALAAVCTGTGANFNCGPYAYSQADNNPDGYVINSNGFNDNVQNNCWADPNCQQTITASDPGNWSVTGNEPAGNGSVMTGPQASLNFGNWCAAESTWQNLTKDGCGNNPIGDTPLSALSSLTGATSDSFPHNSQTIAEAGWDIWTNYSADIMVWNDTVNRCNSGSFGGTTLATGVAIGSHVYDVYRYGDPGGEIIFVEEGPGGVGTCAQDASPTVDLKGILSETEALGIKSNITLGLLTYTFELCSTGGSPETFSLSHLTVAGQPGSGGSAPAVTTSAASSITDTGATLNGSVNPEGQATTYQMDYGTTTGYGNSVPIPPGDAGSGTSVIDESQVLTSLQAGTQYHYRIEATNATSTSYGGDQTFTTTGGTAVTADSSAGAKTARHSSLSWSQTVGSGSDRALLAEVSVGIGPPDTGCTVSVKDGTVAMTRLGSIHPDGQNAGILTVWGLPMPPSGVNTITAKVSGCSAGTPAELTGGSVSFAGVSQSAPFGAVTTADGTGAVASVTTPSANNNIVAGFVANGSAIASVHSPATSLFIENKDNNTAAGNSAGAISAATGSAVTISWSQESDWWGAAILQVQHSLRRVYTRSA
jgi:hypothetical protein